VEGHVCEEVGTEEDQGVRNPENTGLRGNRKKGKRADVEETSEYGECGLRRQVQPWEGQGARQKTQARAVWPIRSTGLMWD